MRRRITESIAGVTALILIALGIPLAIAVHQTFLDSEVVAVQAIAARTLTEINLPLDSQELAAVGGERDAPPPFSVYDANGNLFFGDGPAVADSVVLQALTGNQASTIGDEIVVATPVTDHTTEKIVGALRLTESLAYVNHRSRVAWLIMGSVALAALALGSLIANRLAQYLAKPISDLAAAAAHIGAGGAIERTLSSGIAEIDTVAVALADSSERVNEALARERRFSADVSHQLRTPLTGIRLRLEAGRSGSDPAFIDLALDDLTRLERTVEHLLAFARDAEPATSTVELDIATRRAQQRWADRIASAGRSITVTTSESVTARGSATAIDQILDTLIDNALQHGRGDIQVALRRITGGGAIDVSDHGADIGRGDSARIFQRGHGNHNGIGLALARSIAEAEGGRLLLTHHQPTTFSLILLHPDEAGDS